MKKPTNVLIFGASYGSLLATKLVLAGHRTTLVCTPASRAQEVGLALGARAGEERMRNVVTEAGFTRFRRAAETPVNIVYEAKP